MIITCRVPLLRYITIARLVRNHFFMNMAGGSVCLSSFFTNISPPWIKCSSMYCAKYMRSVVFFLCSLGASSMLHPNTRLLKSLYCMCLKDAKKHGYRSFLNLSEIHYRYFLSCRIKAYFFYVALYNYLQPIILSHCNMDTICATTKNTSKLFVRKDKRHLRDITHIMSVDMGRCNYTLACD